MAQPALTIASLIKDPALRTSCGQWLREAHHELFDLGEMADPGAALESRWEQFDAVLLEQGLLDRDALQRLCSKGLVLPTVILGPITGQLDFHAAEVHLAQDQLEQLSYSVDAAISRFLRRDQNNDQADPDADQSAAPWNFSDRLKKRLGYTGLLYKRDPSRFLRNLPKQEREILLQSLERTYRDLLISYFRDPAAANQALDSFVNTVYFSDLSVTKTVEIHMNLIDEFWTLLKLKGHKNDFLRDYRLALMDVLANLCEMYRRSLPSESLHTNSLRSARIASVAGEIG
ncbi:circadian clock protein KaiA [Synechococcus sp. CS-602]|uniref:circadian clock protein KaiA n=1 Tax=Synechococcaceae TaxID=1890426 RepID=UPI0008FF6771|nr:MULTISPECIES: circadian clock protein KaiA [Synechococcaceae]MCT4364509.1 circadian clock protein KaiA [Candidatus Regnicoccus frigidus MAG-AL1]APD48519.1 circadian clock protein KaiA [Synechococcus sp. SynAce01]MCT0205315.1 circadian clock protein KaiA [Synechococcus sp. CS-602]MCT0246809.1 circadian clock protein KaiA [Synechococcus sp. CS-601]MCT4367888.1 circadian clock protein KaiA [Candidatus Regnicoccus frigidus MAG-AL2]